MCAPSLQTVINTFKDINTILATDPDAGGVDLKACNLEYYQDQIDAMVQDYGLPKKVADEFLSWLAVQV